ncbi:hypothetical protein V6N12_019984 [Hibiscus sabdariffa]|uniref:Uncharacterized protein n=1 Tax=Hibiscus sabdariffa TaxID=183260 RepID=A0ABR2BGI8_9ROSI
MYMVCGFISTTYEPCVDISLDLEPNQGGFGKSSSVKSHNSCNVEVDCKGPDQNCGISSLKGCLERFTRAVKLSPDQKNFCQKCQFPFSLGMTPYLSSSILRSRFGNMIFPFDGDEQDASNDLSNEFELFVVVTLVD